MKRILLIVMLFSFLPASAQNSQESLWEKVRKASSEGKRQTEVNLLKELDSKAIASGDSLERLVILRNLTEAVWGYNWNELSVVEPQYQAIKKYFESNLEGNIARYAAHPQISELQYMLLSRKRDEAYSDSSGAKLLEVRKGFDTLARQTNDPSLKKHIAETIKAMDASSGYVYNIPNQVLKESRIDFVAHTINVKNIGIKLRRKNGNTISWETVKVNGVYGFGKETKLSVYIPSFGEYSLEIYLDSQQKASSSHDICCSNLTVFTRWNGNHNMIFVADALSGRAIEDVDVVIGTERQKYRLDGFTALRDDSYISPENRRYEARVQVGEDKWCPAFVLHKKHYSYIRNDSIQRPGALAISDRTLYMPGEEVKFKIICYKNNYQEGLIESNHSAIVKLYSSASRSVVDSITLRTGPMGSAAGSFKLSQDCRRGRYSIIVDDMTAGNFNVESYLRPSFKVELEDVREPVIAGDMVSLKVKATSYASYPIAGGQVDWKVRGSKNIEGKGITDSEGEFVITFATKEHKGRETFSSYRVEASVSERNGETQNSPARYVLSSSNPVRLSIELDCCEAVNTHDFCVVDKNSAKEIRFVGTTATGQYPVEIDGRYELIRQGRVIRSDSFKSNSKAVYDFFDMASGLYTVKAHARYRGLAVEDSIKFLLISFNDSKVDIPQDQDIIYIPLKTDSGVEFIAGTGAEEYHLFAGLSDKEGNIITHKKLQLTKGLKRIHLDIPRQNERDEMSLELRAVKDMNIFSFTNIFNRKKAEAALDLSIAPIKEPLLPQSEGSISIKGTPDSELAISIYDISNDRGKERYIRELFDPFRPMLRVENDAIMVKGYANAKLEDEPQAEVEERTNLSELVAFFPQVKIGKDSSATVKFTTSGLLGTFRVLAYAHQKDLRSQCVSSSYSSQKPLMVRPNFPLFVREGDLISLKCSIVNMSDKAVEGQAAIEIFNEQGERLMRDQLRNIDMTLAGLQQKEASWDIRVPDCQKLKVRMSFSGSGLSDAQSCEIAVESNLVPITDAISFVMGGKKSFKYYEKELRKRIGRQDISLQRKEFSALEAVKEAMPKISEPSSDNAISWINALYLNQMSTVILNKEASEELRGKADKKLEELQDQTEGFAWFKGMRANQNIGRYFLEKMDMLRKADAIIFNKAELKMIEREITLIDKRITEDKASLKDLELRQRWSNEQVLSKDVATIFDRQIKQYKESWLELSLIDKVSLCEILLLRGEEEATAKLAASVADYAVQDETAGCYFPNASATHGGLMTNEIYAQCRMALLMDHLGNKKITDGLAKWILLQKHSQKWENEVANCDAIYVLNRCGAKDLKIGAVYASYEAALEKVEEGGNGIKVKRSFVQIGRQVTVRYEIFCDQECSFVKMKAMRPAALYPRDEKSGYNWSGYYREIMESHTNYYWQRLPKGKTVVEERFNVNQQGQFSSGIVEIESLYADFYRGHSSYDTFK